MYRNNSSGAPGGGGFKETPAPATRLVAKFMNALQEEMANVVEDATGGNMALDDTDNGQLLAAILAMIGRSVGLTESFGEVSVNLGGFVIKIGSIAGSYGEGAINHDFVTPFPTTCLAVVPIVINAAGSFTCDFYGQRQSRSAGSFTVYLNRAPDAGGTLSGGIDWVAFGM